MRTNIAMESITGRKIGRYGCFSTENAEKRDVREEPLKVPQWDHKKNQGKYRKWLQT